LLHCQYEAAALTQRQATGAARHSENAMRATFGIELM
jgi:hypothetical protein